MTFRAVNRNWEPIKIDCVIERVGHAIPYPNGSFVVMNEMHRRMEVGVKLYENLHMHYRDQKDARYILSHRAGVGSIMGFEYYAEPLDLCRSRIDPPTYDAEHYMLPAKIREAQEQMHYIVAFAPGLVWVRYDWIEAVTEPV